MQLSLIDTLDYVINVQSNVVCVRLFCNLVCDSR